MIRKIAFKAAFRCVRKTSILTCVHCIKTWRGFKTKFRVHIKNKFSKKRLNNNRHNTLAARMNTGLFIVTCVQTMPISICNLRNKISNNRGKLITNRYVYNQNFSPAEQIRWPRGWLTSFNRCLRAK